MRYRLIRTNGRSRTQHFEADNDPEAYRYAENEAKAADHPFLLCRAPERGVTQALGIVGEKVEDKKRGRR